MEICGGYCHPSTDHYVQLLQMFQQHKNHTHVTIPQKISTSIPLFSSQLEKEKADMDQFIALQNEKLRVFLEEQRKQKMQHMISFGNRMEREVLLLERQKDQEMAKERRKIAKLEDLLTKTKIQKHAFKRIAAKKDAMAASLKKNIREEMARSSCAEDVESCCDASHHQPNEGKEKKKKIINRPCKSCNCREASFLILPCKHLCCCKVCESLVYSCPVCRSEKQASMEVYMF